MKIEAHGWDLDLIPELGGSIGALRYRDEDILRPAPPNIGTPLDSACFPLLPYCNRIARGMFAFGGERHSLPLNFGDHPHSLHGLGWQLRWEAERKSKDIVILSQAHGGGEGWPWPYAAQQDITLADGKCTIALRMRNLADESVPAGLGLHPYFPCAASTRLTAAADRLWLANEEMLPTHPATSVAAFGDWREGAAVAGNSLIDHAYDGWNGAASIAQETSVIDIHTVGASCFHLYRPAHEAFFCFEPVAHLPDAINRGGMPTLPPGGTAVLSMTLEVEFRADQ